MSKSPFVIKLLFCLGVVFAAPCIGNAGTIVSSFGQIKQGFALGGPGDWVGYESWTMSDTYSNISITADLFSGGSTPITTYLTNVIGPAETVADQIATSSVIPGSDGESTLFSGLTLGPGTYYLVLTGPHDAFLAWDQSLPTTMVGAGPTVVTTASDVTYNGSFASNATNTDTVNPPASSFFPFSGDNGDYIFHVTGDEVSSTPEPGTLNLLLVGALGGFGLRKRRSLSVKKALKDTIR
ncbi:MAG TPA: PEP-CTERM sorting domain-containing protein [Bryobacteraceae bacterium]|jgi:hypothetical protein|nr:PEP-CTERM sorting domain-containing protein [Bryobacteraceae bacterium]